MQTIYKYKTAIVLVLLVVIGMSLYGNTFNNEFFWDDDDSIVNNAYIKDWQYLPKYFTENLIAGAGQTTNYYRPVLLISFALDYNLWGLNPTGFHLTNALLHIIAAWLIFFILRLLLRKQGGEYFSLFIPFLVSLFFLIHPLQTEAVTYVAGRADSLSSVFSLLAILCYIYYRFSKSGSSNRISKILKFYGAAVLFFVLGLLTKEQVILLPALILLVELVFFTKKFNKKNVFNVLKIVFPFFLISIIYFTVRLTLLDFNNMLSGFEYGEVYDYSVWHRLLTFGYVMLLYFKLLFIPTGLHMAREVSMVTSFFSWPVLLFLAILAIIIVVSVKTWKKNRLVAFGFAWFFIILLPRTNIFQINRPMYEHWLYLPMMGFWLAVFCLAVIIFKKIRVRNKKLALMSIYLGLGALVIYMAGFSTLTILRNNDWQDAITFYEKNLYYTPNSFIQHNNLGMAYADANRIDEAIKEYKKALEISDVYAQVHHNLANSLRDSDQEAEAIKEYKKAITMSPTFSLSYNNLLAIFIEQQNKERAEELLKQMKVVFSSEPNYLYVAGVAHFSFNDYDKAVEYWRELLKIEPGNRAVRELISQAKAKKVE